MGFLNKLFGKKPKQQYPRWVEVGGISQSFQSEFRSHAERILASICRHGYLSQLFISEPTPGYFGSSRQEFSTNVIQHLSQLLEAQEMINITSEGPKRIQTPGLYPKVREALDNDKGVFLIGTTDDGRRHVAFVVLE